jgi:hypothetical protein
MDFEEFSKSISTMLEPPAEISLCLQALWWAKKGDWYSAHDIAQEIIEPNGSWVHAYLHRVEGDIGNAGYWYSKAGKPSKTNESLTEEWEEITRCLLTS